MKKIKICIATGSRSEFGLLKNLLIKLNKSNFFKAELVVLGSHFDTKFGNTVSEIINSNIKISKQIKILNNDFSSRGIIKNFSQTILKLNEKLKNKKYDMIILLGDRYETFACALYAYFNGIPISHIHGGEITYGSLDDGIRHAITKLSHFHFVSNLVYKKRITQLGEQPKNIFIVGGLGIENIKKTIFLKKKDLIKKLNIHFSKNNILVVFHPETTETKRNNLIYIKNLIHVLRSLNDTTIFITGSNADKYNNFIDKELKKFAKLNKNVYFFNSLGSQNYLSLLKNMNCLIGNSSSGIIEAPFLKIPTINIGNRQIGRQMSKSIINTNYTKNSINKALKKIMSNKNTFKQFNNQYGNLNSSDIIIKTLKKINYSKISFKIFNDL